MAQSELRLSFSNLHADNSSLAEDWEILLRVVADFEISAANRIIYREQEFCVVEFGIQAIQWSRSLQNDEFVYRTMESEELGIVFITNCDTGWQIGSIHQESEAPGLPLPVVRAAIEDYWIRLHETVVQQFDRDIKWLLWQRF